MFLRKCFFPRLIGLSVINIDEIISIPFQGTASQGEEKQQGDVEGRDPVHEQLLGGEQSQDLASGGE